MRFWTVVWIGSALTALSSLAGPVAAQEHKGEPKAPPAAGQESFNYLTLPVSPALKANASKANEVRLIVLRVLQGALPLADNEQLFSGYFTAYLFPQMTQPENLVHLPKAREALFKDYLRRQGSPEAHDRLIKVTLEQMTKIAKGNYHPAARVNAMLIIGELNTTENNPVQRQTEQPMLEALNVMLDEVANPNEIDGVRVAALVGILRHAEMDRQQPPSGRKMPASASAAVVARMVPLITTREPPANRSAEGHAWMQRRAIEIVAALGQPDKGETIPAALDALLLDDDAPFSLRAAAAAGLGRLAPACKKLDAGETARNMGALALAIFSSDAEALGEQERRVQEKAKAARAAGAAAGVAVAPIAVDDPANESELALQRYQLEPIRRRLKQLLGEVNTGLVGSGKEGVVSLVTKEPAKAQANEIADAVAGLIAIVDKPTLARAEFLASAKPYLAALRGAAKAAEEKKPAAAPSKPAKPKDEFGDDELR